MSPSAKNRVASILARLRNQATEEGVSFNQVLQFYAIERFLWRLSQSSHAESVVLKGALLLKTIGIPRARPTMDIDFLRKGRSDSASLIALVRDCANIENGEDGISFDSKTISAQAITKDAEYQGTRVRVAARLGTVRLSVQIDFGVGDAVVPRPKLIEYPVLLNQAGLTILAYPIEAVVAEKFQAMIELEAANSRMKDFYDVYTCSRHCDFEGGTLVRSLTATFKRRSTELPIELPVAFTSAFFDDEAHLKQWRAFAQRIGEPELSDRFGPIVGDVASFLMPVAIAASREKPFAQRWEAGGPWQAT